MEILYPLLFSASNPIIYPEMLNKISIKIRRHKNFCHHSYIYLSKYIFVAFLQLKPDFGHNVGRYLYIAWLHR